MRRKASSILGLVGFAAVAAAEALGGADIARAVPRAMVAAVVMAAVGYVAGCIAERAISEAVDASLPAYGKENGDAAQQGQESEAPDTEVG